MVGEINQVIDEIMNDLGFYIFSGSQENLVDNGTIDTGFLLRSGSVGKENRFVTIHYDAPYAEAIEKGTDPHKVSPKMLEGWVRRKMKIKNPAKVRSIAIAISKKIQARGTKPQPYVDPAINKAKLLYKGKSK